MASNYCTAASSPEDGAAAIFAAATHGLFTGAAPAVLERAPLDRPIVTDSAPLAPRHRRLREKTEVLSIASLLADAIREGR